MFFFHYNGTTMTYLEIQQDLNNREALLQDWNNFWQCLDILG